MSDNNQTPYSEHHTPYVAYGMDYHGRIVQNESGVPQSNISCLPSIQETLSRLTANLSSDRQSNISNNEMSDLQPIVILTDEASQNAPQSVQNHESSTDVVDGATVPNQSTPSVPPLDADDDKRYCWVCFATDEDDVTASWVKPCHCRGTTKWVHQGCIQRWVDEKQKSRVGAQVACPQCNTEYIIIYPDMSFLVIFLDKIDAVIFRVCPFLAAGVVVGSIYWTATTYGAVTFMQVVGYKDGLRMMEKCDPLILLVGLPIIPIMLILGKMLRWEDQVLNFIRRHACKVPILRHFLPSHVEDERVHLQDVPPMSDPVSATRIFCGALVLPMIATACGKMFFEHVKSSFRRTLLGGIAFITIKGAFKIYYKQQKYVRQCQRRIMDYTESNVLNRRQPISETQTS